MITLRNLSLQRGNKFLLDKANLTIHAGQKVGIIGANGCGKTSLLTLLRGLLSPDSGDLEIPTQWQIAHVAQETPALEQPAIEFVLDGDRHLREIESALATEQTGLRTAELHAQLEAIDGYTAKARAAQLLDGLGFVPQQIDHPVKTFSGGWRMRLNLAQALMARSDLLLLDEPTNHLDLDAVFWFEQWLKSYPGTLLLISHDRDFLDNTVTHIVHFEGQKIDSYTGNYSDFERQRAEKLAQQQAAYTKQQQEIEHIQKFVDRFRAKASKAKQAQSRLKALERMEAIAPAHIDSPFHFQFPRPDKLPGILIDLEKMAIGYQQQPVLEKINLTINTGDRIGLLGPNGAGKSTLIKLLAGQLTPLSGQWQRHEGLKIGYFAQHQLEQLNPQANPLQHLQQIDSLTAEQTLRNFLGGFGFPGDMALQAVAPFSGGEKARLALALIIYQKPNLLLLDEPTNHLDLEMRHALTQALQAYQGALMIVSHDRHLLRTTTDELWLVAQQRVQSFSGDLNDYRQWLLTQRSQQKKSTTATTSPNRQQQKRQQAAQREKRRPLQNKLKQLEQDLAKLTTDKQNLEMQLAEPAIYEDKQKVAEFIQQQSTLTTQLQQTEEKWLEVMEALEAVDNTKTLS